MTDFKREARYRQHRWALEHGVSGFGWHANTSRNIAAGLPELIPNGTKLTDQDAEAGKNFLSPTIWQVVLERIASPQPYQTLEADRLKRDLLSSMPMAFNLFAEASRHPESMTALARLLAPGATPDPSAIDIIFEWSPGRRSAQYTRDRTAFDVALRIGNEPRTVVGIETKYHEDARPDRPPRPSQQDFLVALADSTGVFKTGWQHKVLTTALRQVWRDHLLALSLRRHPDQWAHGSRYVLIYPRRNRSFRQVATEYAAVLASPESFQAVTLEDVVDSAFAHGGGTRDRFVERYLWW